MKLNSLIYKMGFQCYHRDEGKLAKVSALVLPHFVLPINGILCASAHSKEMRKGLPRRAVVQLEGDDIY